MRLVALALFLSLSGCAELAAQERAKKEAVWLGYQNAKMASWVGHKITEMVSTYGPPTERYQNGDTMMWIWVIGTQTVTSSSGGSSALYGQFGGGAQAHSTNVTEQVDCREWADVDSAGMVVGGHSRGNCAYWKRRPPPAESHRRR